MGKTAIQPISMSESFKNPKGIIERTTDWIELRKYKRELKIVMDPTSKPEKIEKIVNVNPSIFSKRLIIFMAASENPTTPSITIAQLFWIGGLHNEDPLLLNLALHSNADEITLSSLRKHIIQKKHEQRDVRFRKHYLIPIKNTVDGASTYWEFVRVDAGVYWELILSAIANHKNANIETKESLKHYIRLEQTVGV